MQRYKKFEDPLWYFHRRLMLRYKIFSCTCTDTWCFVTRLSIVRTQTLDGLWKDLLVLAQTLGATLTDLLLYLHRHLRLIIGSSLVLAQTLGATWKDFSSYLRSHLMLRYRMLRAGLGLGDHTIGGGVNGRRPGPHIYIYICMYSHCAITCMHACMYFHAYARRYVGM